MSRIRSKDTEPEMRVRRALHARGYRFRVHRIDLPARQISSYLGSGSVYSSTDASGMATRTAKKHGYPGPVRDFGLIRFVAIKNEITE